MVAQKKKLSDEPYFFDKVILKRQVHKIALREHLPWEENEYCEVIGYYTDMFRQHTGREHPIIAMDTLRIVMADLEYGAANSVNLVKQENLDEYFEPYEHREKPFEPDEYPELINLYFEKQTYEDCDRHIYHFLSGAIRFNLKPFDL